MALNARHALVTGGGTGIGLAIATALAEQGAEVTITGRRLDVLQQAAEGTPRLHPAVMDVTDATEVAKVTAKAVAAHGPLSICIANAGIAEGRSLLKTDPDFWRKIMATNLDGAYLTIREALRSMHGQEWGRVIAISSVAGTRGLKGAAAYSASKHGVIGLIRALSEDYLGKGITFNAICPAYVETEIISRNVTSIKDRAGISEQEARAIMVNTNPHGRLIDTSEIASAALWLCSDGADSVNGQAIQISGGMM